MMGSAPAVVGGQLGRYELRGAIARGGMATVHIGRMSGAAGFARTVAIKRLHPHLASDRVFSAMFVDEARLTARIQHPNVVDTLDVVSDGEELLIVMEFVHGETLSKLVRAAANQAQVLPAPVVSSIVIGALEGLHAAHEAVDERGQPLGIVHRDVSPQNILVATDGVPRVLDFGVAKAAGRVQETEGSEIKGKLAYMSPEQLTRKHTDRRSDIFAMGVVLWEALTSKRLFLGDDAASTLYSIINDPIKPPSSVVGGLPPAIDEVVLKSLERDPSKRYATAEEMALALEAACMPAPARHAGKWVMELAGDAVNKRMELVRSIEGAKSPSSMSMPASDDGSHPSGSGSQRITSSARLAPAPESWRHLSTTHSESGTTSGSGISNVSHLSHLSSVSTVSQFSSMSNVLPMPISAPPSQPPRVEEEADPPMSRQLIIAIAAIGGLTILIALIGVFAVVNKVAHRKHPPAAASSSAPTVVLADPAPPPPPSAVVAPAPTSEPAPPPTESVAAAPAPAPPTAEPAKPKATAVAPAATPKPVKSAAPNLAAECENPFVVGPDGIKRPKPQCFNR